MIVGHPQQLVSFLFEQDKDKLFEIKEKRQKRTLTQNAYYYKLESELASVLSLPNDELHLNMLKKYAPYTVVYLRADVPGENYFKYCEKVKNGLLSGKEIAMYKVYKSSSELDTKEFKRLLDGMIDECNQQGIPTLTPDELAKLKALDERESI